MSKINYLKVLLSDKISDVIRCIQNSGALACAILYDNDGRFLNIITDGDVRRAFLAGHNLDDAAVNIQNIKFSSSRAFPITANINSSCVERDLLFSKYTLRQLILVDDQGCPVDVVPHEPKHINPINTCHEFTAVMMAGGFGTRLRPLTASVPKPMLKINGRPMLEISIQKLISYGAKRFYITTHYLPEQIMEHFGNGENYGVEINYIHENEPLGTGGALSLISKRDENTLVFNGDILTDLDVRIFLAHHVRSRASLTVATTQYRYQVPYGVLTEKNGLIEKVEEKPSFSFMVNSGIYFIKDEVFSTLPKSGAYNMTDVLNSLVEKKKPVSCFPIFEHWLDVGRPSDYDLASALFS